MTHPYDALELKPGKEISLGPLTVVVRHLYPKETIGYARGWVDILLPASGLLGERRLTVTVKELGYDNP